MSRAWVAAGCHVQVATCFPNHPTGNLYPGYTAGRYMFESMDGIDVHRYWTYRAPNAGFLKKTAGHISLLPSVMLGQRRMKRPDVTIGTSPTFFAAMAAERAARKFNVPFIMDVRDLWPGAIVELGVLRNRTLISFLERIELRLYRRASRVVTVTKAFRENLIERGVAPDKIHVVQNGADPEFWNPSLVHGDLRQRLKLEDRFVVLYIGAHGISQALSRVLEAARLLRADREIHFLFVGEGAEKSQLMRQTETEGLTNVEFRPSVGKEEVRDYYAAADVCLVPLRDVPLFKTFIPSKMFEIMAMGCPIVASVRGESADILQESGAAEVVAPEDSRAMAEAIRNLSREKLRRTQMAGNGRGYVERQFSRNALARRYLDVIGQAIARPAVDRIPADDRESAAERRAA